MEQVPHFQHAEHGWRSASPGAGPAPWWNSSCPCKAGIPSTPVGIWWKFSSWRLGGEQAVLVGGVFAASEQAAQRSATGVCSDSHPPLPCSALGSVWML